MRVYEFRLAYGKRGCVHVSSKVLRAEQAIFTSVLVIS
jgi:hypothetical protein